MYEFLKVLLIVFVVFGGSFMLINIKHIIKGEEFRGSCSSNNPYLKNELGDCTVCGKKPEEQCKMPEIDAKKA